MNPTKNNCPTIAVLYLFLSIAITLLMAQTPFSKSALAADYEGFGTVTRGALDAPGGYETYHVTSLADDGSEGTLRHAITGFEAGSRLVVFDVGGTITATGALRIRSSYITVDGNTAPSPGITLEMGANAFEIEGSGFLGSAHDIIINNLRVIGPGSAGSADLLALTGWNYPVFNIIIDHCTVSSIGDGLDIAGDVKNVTVSWNLIYDSGMAILMGPGADANLPRENISIHHNVFARNSERQPKISSYNEVIDLVNNVIYGWGWDFGDGSALHFGTEIAGDNPKVNVENNVYHYVAGVVAAYPDRAIRWEPWGSDEGYGEVYFNGNIWPVEEEGNGSTSEQHEIAEANQVTMYDASTLGDTVVPFAGTHYPTQEEQDLLSEISIAIDGQAAPIANAGSDQTITDSDGNGSEQVTLDGSGSTDSDGTIQSYVWTEGGTQIATGVSPNVTLSTGQHTITLTVTDDDGATDTDTVTITISASHSTDYEGFGAVTRGALDAPGGYETFHVTSLADSGPGTLREAVDGYGKSNRYIVFDVGGTITLTSSLYIRSSYITIDGSSAPSPGITIIQPGNIGTYIYGDPVIGPIHDIIIHHLRNDGQGGYPTTNEGDIWEIDALNGVPASNIILDHITGIGATDAIFDILGDVSDVTVSWNLITDTVNTLLVKDYGMGIENISFHHNVFARNNERQPLIWGDSQLIDVVNNVVYGWCRWESGWGGLTITHTVGETNPSLNVENNVYHFVPGVGSFPGQAIIFIPPVDPDVYFNGNILPPEEVDAVSNSPRLPIPSYAEVIMYNASTLGDTVVPYVGTHYPTQEEQDLLSEISIAIGTSGNHAPIANAGSDQTITDSDANGSEQGTLDGSSSKDPDGTIVSYVWSEDALHIATGINPTVILSTGTHLITLTVTDNGGLTDTDTVTVKVLKGDKEFGKLPGGCYNNVFNPAKGERALIVVELAEQAHVRLNLYNTRGNKIRELADEQKEAGTHKYYWDGKSDSGNAVGSGLYFVHIQARDYKKIKKIVIIK